MATENLLNEDKQGASQPPPTHALKNPTFLSQIHQCGNFVDSLDATSS